MTTQANPIQRRARAQLSCMLCRAGKLKCDRGHPCDQCVKRSKDAQCHYQPAPRKKPRKPTSTRDRIAQLESLVVKLMNQDSDVSPTSTKASISTKGADEPIQELTPESRATLSSPEQLDGSDGEDSDEEGSDGGRISITNGGANYVGGAHWESILSRIEQLKTTVGSDNEETTKQNDKAEVVQADSRMLLMGSPTVTKDYLIKSGPTKEVAERLLFAWFNSHNPMLPLIHRPTFLVEYEQFLHNPINAPAAWLAMYFGILALGCQILTSGSQPFIQGANGPTSKDAAHYHMLSNEALVLADVAKPQKYIVEALMTSATSEHLRGDAGNSLRLWLLLSIILRLCMRMGYHRDPSLLKSLSAFECEMRRRVWYTVYIFDVLVSFSMGLPDMIRQIQSDTRPPRNLLDTDFGPETAELPASRPFTELTPVAYGIVKSRIAKLFARAADISHSIAHPDIRDVNAIDEELEDAYGRIPENLKFVSMRHCMFDPPPVIFNRFKLQLMYQKTRCVLYRRYLAGKNLKPEEESFREKCAEAAVNLLKHWETLHDASQQGGQLATMPFFLDSLSVADFLLAVMIACLELENLRRSNTALDAKAQERLSSIKAALEATHRVYTKSLNDKQARMPEKALKALEAILNKAQISTPEIKSSTAPSTSAPLTYVSPPSASAGLDASFNAAQSLLTPNTSYTSTPFSWQEPLNNNFANTEAINWQMWDASLRNSMMIDQTAVAPCPYDGLDMSLDMVGGMGGFNDFDGSMSTDLTTTAQWF